MSISVSDIDIFSCFKKNGVGIIFVYIPSEEVKLNELVQDIRFQKQKH